MTLRADIATGETTLDRTDLRLEGALPLALARQYRSRAPTGIFGLGWRHGLDRTLRVEPDRIVYGEASGRETVFAPVAVGMEVRHPEGLTLQHHADVWTVFASPLVRDVFRKDSRGGAGGVLLLERIVDPNGNRIKLEYAGGRLTHVTGAAGQNVHFRYVGGVVGQIVVTGAGGSPRAVRTFRYGAGPTLVSETDATGRTTEYAYQDGLLVRAGTAGAAWLAQYDRNRHCIALWSTDGTATYHLAYDPLRQTTRAVATDGRQTLYRHALGSAGSVVLERVDAAGESLHYHYDEAQRLIGHSGPDGTTITFQRLDREKGERFQIDYERRTSSEALGPGGLVASVDGGGGGAFSFSYDEWFNLVRLTTPLGAKWGFERDRKGRVSALLTPAGRRLGFRHDGATVRVEEDGGVRLSLTSDLFGRVATRTDRRGREQRFRYDEEGRLTAVEVGDGYRVGYRVGWEYDAAGRAVRVADSEGNEVRRTRDGAGRVLAVETGKGAVRFAYDLAGRISKANGAAGEVQFVYDARDRLVRAAGSGRTCTFAYGEGRVAVASEGHRRAYSVHGDLVEEHAPGGRIRRFEYGPSGELRIVEREGAGEATLLVLDYDSDGRLVSAERDGEAVTFAYDPDGLLTSVEGSGLSLRLGYDARSRPARLDVGEAVYHFGFDDGDRLEDFGEGGESGRSPALAPSDPDDTVLLTPLAPYAPSLARHVFRYDALDRCVAYRGSEEGEVGVAAGAVERVPVGDGLTFFVALRGLALVVEAGSFVVPLWGHEEARLLPLRLDARIVRALVLGPEGALVAAYGEPGPPVERWQALAVSDGLGVPSAAVFDFPWPVLDFFALARDRYDPHFARRLPGTLPHHVADAARTPDEPLTGSHRSGALQPGVWAERAHGPHLDAHSPRPSSDAPDHRALHLYQTLTSP